MSTTVQANSCYLTVNGLRLHYLDWGNPEAPHLVFVHGLTGTGHAFDNPARRFRDRYHIMAVDVRGRGDSAWSPDGKYEYEDYASDLEGMVAQLGLRRFTLIGTSMGGIISMIYASKHAQHLERLVINDIGPDPEEGSNRITQNVSATPASFGAMDEALAYRRTALPAVAKLSEADQREQALFLLKRDPAGRWVWKMDPEVNRQRAANGAPVRPPLWPALAGLPCPALVLWGMESDVLSETQAKRMLLTLPKGELAPVPGVGHAPNLMEPEAVAALDRFLG